jgi:dihydropteroate synthase
MSLAVKQLHKKTLNFRNFEFDFSKRTYVMGVLNITPDSFSDGGLFFDTSKAIDQAVKMSQEGADIIDVGGESTRPGAEPVSESEELKRVIPVIEGLSRRINVPISIDTKKPEVAREAVNAGASLINDIMGTPLDRQMACVAADFDIPLVIMHIKGEPQTMQKNPVYDDVVDRIMFSLRDSIAVAEEMGVDAQKIIIDPGIGFGKTVSHNIEIIKRLRELRMLGRPVLVGPSRKSFIGSILDISEPKERLIGTAAAVAAAIVNGADIVRVHDVREMLQVCKILNKIFKT